MRVVLQRSALNVIAIYSVRSSVCLSVTGVRCIKTASFISKWSWAPSNHVILVWDHSKCSWNMVCKCRDCQTLVATYQKQFDTPQFIMITSLLSQITHQAVIDRSFSLCKRGTLAFYRALFKRGLCCRLVSVCLSVTFLYCIQTAEDVVQHLSRPGSSITVVLLTRCIRTQFPPER